MLPAQSLNMIANARILHKSNTSNSKQTTTQATTLSKAAVEGQIQKNKGESRKNE